MGVLGKELFRLNKSFFEFTVLFSDNGYEIEGTVYRLGELTTAFLNYDAGAFSHAVEELQAGRAVHADLRKMFQAMPLYCDMARGEKEISDDDLADHCTAIAEDIRLIQERYAWLLREMFYRDFGLRTPNRYAIQLSENGLDAFVSGRSLGLDPERDPVASAVQFEVRESAGDGAPTLFEKRIFTRLADFIYTELFRALMCGNSPRACKNCGRWFSKERNDTYEYCGGIAPGEETKTCRDIGATASFHKKVKNSEVWQLHQRAYKKYYARVMKGAMTKAEFNTWAQEAETLRDRALVEFDAAQKRGLQYSPEEYRQALNRP